jgi:hypothetical protein
MLDLLRSTPGNAVAKGIVLQIGFRLELHGKAL